MGRASAPLHVTLSAHKLFKLILLKIWMYILHVYHMFNLVQKYGSILLIYLQNNSNKIVINLILELLILMLNEPLQLLMYLLFRLVEISELHHSTAKICHVV